MTFIRNQVASKQCAPPNLVFTLEPFPITVPYLSVLYFALKTLGAGCTLIFRILYSNPFAPSVKLVRKDWQTERARRVVGKNVRLEKRIKRLGERKSDGPKIDNIH